MGSPVHNIVVIGGSYVGKAAAQKLAEVVPPTHKVLLIEPHAHFHHIFTFPRFAVVPGHEHKAFIPYTNIFASTSNAHAIVRARVLAIHPDTHTLTIDRPWLGSTKVPYEYVVIATGTSLTPPSATNEEEKLPSVIYLRNHQDQIKRAKSILLAGGGAAGIQMATDIKEVYPDKEVTLVQSRERLMPKFDGQLHDLISARFRELGIKLVTGARVIIPAQGFPTQAHPIDVQLTNGTSIPTDFVILATGQKPNNDLVANLATKDKASLINPANGMIRVRATLQVDDERYDNIFAVGDIADTGAHKAARPGIAQAEVVVKNVMALIQDQKPQARFEVAPAAIHMTLGLTYNVVFGNPAPSEGRTEPRIVERHDGQEDMAVDNMWKRMGVTI
ncbi:hypothetical protein DV737_g2721, partial [Chaetothyriales sp. CBS 132003]